MTQLRSCLMLLACHPPLLSTTIPDCERYTHRGHQNRLRVFIIGQRRVDMTHRFKFPAKRAEVKLSAILDKRREPDSTLPMSRHAAKMVLKAHHMLRTRGVDPHRACIAVDCDSSRGTWMVEKSPCITATRGRNGGHWVCCKNRRMTIAEMLKAQGVDPTKINTSCIGRRQLGEAIGNSMTQTVLEAILQRLLPSINLH